MTRSLKELVDELADAGFDPQVTGDLDRLVEEIRFDSRRVGSGELFVALRGAAVDGHRFLEGAAAAGACAMLIEADCEVEATSLPGSPALIRVHNTRSALAFVSARFFGHPGRSLRVVGLTGTNGKTTTTYLLESIATAAGLAPGVIGTVNRRWDRKVVKTRNTTPESLELQRLLRQMKDDGVDVVFMEVSSHALVTHRVEALPFEVGAFLNLSQDHLDFHGSMAAYLAAKARLFENVLPWSAGVLGRAPVAVVNVGDPAGFQIAGALSEGLEKVFFDVGEGDESAMRLARCDLDGSGSRLEIVGGGFEPIEIATGMLGEINVENTMAAVACARALGVDDGAIGAGLASVKGVTGRLERVDGGVGGPLVVVDYAHTPKAVERALSSLVPLASGRIVTVLGCGGDRDKGKRPLMGAAAASRSDLVVATSDNPRSEAPEVIIEQMIEGVVGERGHEAWSGLDWRAPGEARRAFVAMRSRRRAVGVAVGLAREGDLVLIAGKGHETYQEIEGARYPMSDVDEARASLGHLAGRRVAELVEPELWARATGGRLVGRAAPRWRDGNAGIVTDSREVVSGSVFVALRGERFDGHDYVDQVLEAGAALVVVEDEARAREALSGRVGQALVVSDTLEALGDMASLVLDELREARPWFSTAAITGSNGKTTTKELTSALLEAFAGVPAVRIHKNPGNHNNLIGVPLTIFELRYGHDAVVLEMGANAFGEIERLVGIAKPDVRVLTGVSGAHLEGFGSVDGVLKAKSEMFLEMLPGQSAVVPASKLEVLRELFDGEARVGVFDDSGGGSSVSLGGESGVRARVVSRSGDVGGEVVRIVLDGIDSDQRGGTLASENRSTAEIEVRHPLVGAHNAANLSGALIAAWEVGRRLSVWLTREVSGALDLGPSLRLPGGRLAIKAGSGAFEGALILDDCYNANPGSMEAGLRVLRDMARRRGARAIAVLGDMFELGEGERGLHRDVGRRAADIGVDALVGFGALSEATAQGAAESGVEAIFSVTDPGDEGVEAAVGAVSSFASEGAVILVKGSRGMRMERLVAMMTEGGG